MELFSIVCIIIISEELNPLKQYKIETLGNTYIPTYKLNRQTFPNAYIV
jgi:hypothetical protein